VLAVLFPSAGCRLHQTTDRHPPHSLSLGLPAHWHSRRFVCYSTASSSDLVLCSLSMMVTMMATVSNEFERR